ncbi:high nitrogen upregulated cytochrome P450 monooxygenase 2 [Lentinus brumalis]|uniref:High nitrogen upregulated cytochrome P450 monooxygenase 2 n=1 Tax=Lentinus brumalis TaxID=2498619 RepID=A0A371DE28_9APHY|nr:high nitrogen upregulated cytochrome P450 monooxygenase 2 [Polyporus brumalis]
MSLREVFSLTIPLAIAVHQVFRRYEIYSVSFHACLFLVPPALVAAHVSSQSHSSSSISATFVNALVSYVAAIAASVIVYRLSPLHPLARYPGPVWRKVSMIGPAILATSGNRAWAFANMHRKYGDIVRSGPNELSIIDPSFIGPLLGASGLPKGPYHVGASVTPEHVSMAGLQDIPYHLQRRRPWNRGLNPSALKDYQPLIVERLQLLVRRLHEQSGIIDLGLWLKYFAYDFMSDMAFGGGSELLKDGDKNNIWSIIEEGMVFATILHTLPWLGAYLFKIPGSVKPLLAMQQTTARLAEERFKRGSKTRDLYYYLSNEDLPDKPPPPLRELADDGVLAVVAGSDTASLTMTSVFYLLLTHPEAYTKLQEEIDTSYSPGEPDAGTKHHREMPYLHAVINEALRLFPPVPLGTQRQVPHDASPVVFGSVVIPPGTSVYLPTLALHRGPRNFTCPNDFWPERWLIASGQLRYKEARRPPSLSSLKAADLPDFVHNDVAFTPFSVGPMNCPGKGLAMLEMRMVIVELVKHFVFKLRDGWDPATYEKEFKDYFTAARPGLPVIIEPR